MCCESAEVLGIPESRIKEICSKFQELEGRLQMLKEYNGIKIYNDNNATTPEATIASLKALVSPRTDLGKKKIVLICGGADKNLPLDDFAKAVNKYCKAVVMIPGTGTERLIKNYELKIKNEVGRDLNDIVKTALNLPPMEILFFSLQHLHPFGMFNNEYERNDLFMKIIKKLK